MQPTFRFNVVSELPEQFATLQRLAVNLRWVWDGAIDLSRATITTLLNGTEPKAAGVNGAAVIDASFIPWSTGPWGVTARVLPTHPLLSTPLKPGLVARP